MTILYLFVVHSCLLLLHLLCSMLLMFFI
uniref:Uncharacterized protein n=1 Tax=Arundo donax TaxID=35708 RepID=A0A0A9FYE4_ARUDO